MIEIKSADDIKSNQHKIAVGQFDDALVDLRSMLDHDAGHADANYMAAVCYRYKKEFERAQHYLDVLKDSALDKGRVYQEQGHLFRAQQFMPQALTGYQTACQLNPALLASWKAQAELFAAIGDTAAAQQAQAQLHRMQALPKALLAATDVMGQGKILKADALCNKI